MPAVNLRDILKSHPEELKKQNNRSLIWPELFSNYFQWEGIPLGLVLGLLREIPLAFLSQNIYKQNIRLSIIVSSF
jgi:hypothetical protein